MIGCVLICKETSLQTITILSLCSFLRECVNSGLYELVICSTSGEVGLRQVVRAQRTWRKPVDRRLSLRETGLSSF